MRDTNREENTDSCKDCICRWKCLKVNIRAEILHQKVTGIYKPNSLPYGGGKRMHDIHGRSDPFCERIVAILGSAEC